MAYIDVNLLPWRQQQRKRSNYRFVLFCIVSFSASIALIAAIDGVAKRLVEAESESVERLKFQLENLPVINESIALDLQRASKAQSELIKAWHSRQQQVSAISSVDVAESDGLAMTHLQIGGNQLTLKGEVESLSKLQGFVSGIEADPNWQNSRINKFQKAASKSAEFIIKSDYSDSEGAR
ncbi:PilN domain-containing protein [Vibrio sonorensis]|uniref:PilN domain-containing protein n=1 Tax=Vibrio sonorensis TaxID=1004316 RepID=UPI0008D9F06E|nr:hypothetical protein [Vibrio sonorensis]